jgi:hypothetical protein
MIIACSKLVDRIEAGEIAERFEHYLVWDNNKIVARFETYRGLNKTLF